MHKCTLINDVKENATSSFNSNSLVVLNYFFMKIENQESRFF